MKAFISRVAVFGISLTPEWRKGNVHIRRLDHLAIILGSVMLLQWAGCAHVKTQQELDKDLLWNAELGRTAKVQALLDEGADVYTRAPIYGYNDTKDTPLHKAVYGGHLEIVRLLLDRGADIETKDSYGFAPLDKAAYSESKTSIEVINLLLDRGANIEGGDTEFPPMIRAASEGYFKRMKLLLDHGANPKPLREDGKPILAFSIVAGSWSLNHFDKRSLKKTISLLIELGHDVNAKDEEGKTPLHHAANRRDFKTAEVLLHYGGDVNAKDYLNSTPLHEVMSWPFPEDKGGLQTLRVLLERGANPNQQDSRGRTPLDLAKRKKKGENTEEQKLRIALLTEAEAQRPGVVETPSESPTTQIPPAVEPDPRHPITPALTVEVSTGGSTVVPPSLPDYDFGRYYALVIGNESYQHLDNLKTAIDDAEAVATVLQNTYGFTVTTLRNAERDEIIEALDRLRAQLTDKDNLLIYYGGHGIFDEKADEGFWLPVDARDNTSTRWLSNNTITNKLKAMTAKHVLVVVDSCYSGTLTRGIRVQLQTGEDLQTFYRNVSSKRSRTVLTSGGLEPVLDGGGGGHSIFAKSFLNVLRTNTGVLDGQGVFEQIRRPILLDATQHPEYDAIRFTGHEGGGDFLFVRQHP